MCTCSTMSSIKQTWHFDLWSMLRLSHGNDLWLGSADHQSFSPYTGTANPKPSYIYWLANMLVSIKTDFWCLNSLFGEYRKSNRGRSEPYMVVSTDVLLNFWMRKLLNLWGIVHPKYKFCHHLLTLMLFQTCMTYFLYWNKDDIFNNVLFLLTSIVWEKKSMEVAHAIEVGCPYH